jgi:hypothetical protein
MKNQIANIRLMNGALMQMAAMEGSMFSKNVPLPIQSVRVVEIPINEDTGGFLVPKSTTSDHQELVFADLPAASTIEVDGKELKEWQYESQRAISGLVKVPVDTKLSSSLPEDVVWYIQKFVGRPKLYVFQCCRCQYIDRDLKKYAVHRPTTSRRRGNPDLGYIMVDRRENGQVVTNAGLCQRYFVKRADMHFQNEFALVVNGHYFREVMPLAFNETVPQDFVVYQIIYQKPPADPTSDVILERTIWCRKPQSCLCSVICRNHEPRR